MSELFYIRCHERGLWSGGVVWWGYNRAGYTQDLAIAGKYTKEEAEEICRSSNIGCDPNEPNETMHLCSEVDSLATRIFEPRYLRELTKHEGWK